MDRPSGNKIFESQELSYDKQNQLRDDFIFFIKDQTKQNSLPTFDELGTEFDLSYDDIEFLCLENDNIHYVPTRNERMKLPRCAWTVLYEENFYGEK